LFYFYNHGWFSSVTPTSTQAEDNGLPVAFFEEFEVQLKTLKQVPGLPKKVRIKLEKE